MRVIPGTARGTVLKTPAGMQTRPTAERVKEALFSALHYDLPGMHVLDLFAGTGQLGIEALSRGAAHCVFVDARPDAAALVQENLRRAKLESAARVVRSDAFAFLSACRAKFDLILLDPPYAGQILENALTRISEIDILSHRGIIICERPIEKQLPDRFGALALTKTYRYGKTAVSLYRKESTGAEAL